jgi:hypothetical protein
LFEDVIVMSNAKEIKKLMNINELFAQIEELELNLRVYEKRNIEQKQARIESILGCCDDCIP